MKNGSMLPPILVPTLLLYTHTNTAPHQALFRPVAMMVPDYRLIAEVSLYANGFRSAAALATNLVSVLKVRVPLRAAVQPILPRVTAMTNTLLRAYTFKPSW